MVRRRKDEDPASMLLAAPWWASVALGSIGFGVMRWIVPSIFASSPLLAGLAALSRALAWLPLLVFGLIGAIVFARSKAIGESPRNNRGNRIEPRIAHAPSIRSFHPNLADGWGASNQPMTETKRRDVFGAWTVEALRALEWKRFELLCARYYDAVGFKSETLRCGADGGIDVKLFKTDPSKPLAVVQCKAWNMSSVGVKEVRELLGVMTHEKVGRGVFITTATYTKDALSFAAENPIQLLDGDGFVRKLRQLPKADQDNLLGFAFDGDYETPTCPSCGIKMTRRDSKRGPFWGCSQYPRCKITFAIKIARPV
ncbi:MAG: hypothetical protein JWP34_1909 [Massilia sp.]|nr:hypothetical protein [Massilia sp.]